VCVSVCAKELSDTDTHAHTLLKRELEMMTYLVLQFHEFPPVLSCDLSAQLVPTHTIDAVPHNTAGRSKNKRLKGKRISFAAKNETST
jgi:hypothetical protein